MKSDVNYRKGLVLTLLLALSLACSSQITFVETAPPVSAETLVAATMTAYTQKAPAVPATFVPTMTALPASPTAETFGEVYVYTNVDNVNLRVNPGMLFKVSRVLPNGTRLKLLGYSPGGEWSYVMNDEGIAGWVNINVITGGYDGPPPPTIGPADVLLVTGIVETELGTPVSGIGFAVTQGVRRTDAVTDASGQFYAYLPSNMSGTWLVEYVSVSCASNSMDANCNCKNNTCGSASPESVSVELPQKDVLNFTWK